MDTDPILENSKSLDSIEGGAINFSFDLTNSTPSPAATTNGNNNVSSPNFSEHLMMDGKGNIKMDDVMMERLQHNIKMDDDSDDMMSSPPHHQMSITSPLSNDSTSLCSTTTVTSNRRKKESRGEYTTERESCLKMFEHWCEQDQLEFMEHLLSRMCHYQHGHINAFLKPMLQRDFISLLPKKGLDHVAEKILSYLDGDSLRDAELVCREWQRVIADGVLWKKLIERKVRTDQLWKGLSERRGWGQFLFKPRPGEQHPGHSYYRKMYPKILQNIRTIEANWRMGRHNLQRINCRSESSKGVYCLQYDDTKIVSGLRDNTIKMWNRNTLQCYKVLTGHTGSVLCLQYDDQVIISGSSDSTVRVWDVNSGEMTNTLIHHCEAVLHLRFTNGLLVTCSKDRSIAVWDMVSASEINLRRVLVGHRAAVNVVDFDEKYIVSASGDRTIKVWGTSTCEFVRTLNGHKRGIACLQYRDHIVVSGSSDNSIRLWDIESGACIRTLEGHEELVRCIRFDTKRIVSGAYDGKIKVWDLQAALDPRSPSGTLCLRTLVEHSGRVFRLQFDEFQIVSSSHDDTILIWDFLNCTPPDTPPPQVPSLGGPPSSSSSKGSPRPSGTLVGAAVGPSGVMSPQTSEAGVPPAPSPPALGGLAMGGAGGAGGVKAPSPLGVMEHDDMSHQLHPNLAPPDLRQIPSSGPGLIAAAMAGLISSSCEYCQLMGPMQHHPNCRNYIGAVATSNPSAASTNGYVFSTAMPRQMLSLHPLNAGSQAAVADGLAQSPTQQVPSSSSPPSSLGREEHPGGGGGGSSSSSGNSPTPAQQQTTAPPSPPLPDLQMEDDCSNGDSS